MIERQYLTVIHHQQFDPRVIVKKQCSKAAVQIVEWGTAHAAAAQDGDTQLESGRARPAILS